MRNRIVIAAVLLLVGGWFLSRTVGQLSTYTLAGIIVFLAALALSFMRGTDALYIIIFAMLFSPEISTGLTTGKIYGGEGVGPIFLRLEDMLLIAIFCGWLLRTAYQRRHFGIIRTPVNLAIGCYMAASVVATLLGVVGGVVRLEAGLVHNLKYFEYFFLYFMILAHVREKQVVTNMLVAILIAFFLSLAYGYTQIDLTGTQRVSAPFDINEPNTFGGYIVLLMCVALGIVLEDKRIKVGIPLISLLILALPPLLFTLSRAAYTAVIAGWLAFMVASAQRIVIGAIGIGLVAAFLIGLLFLPPKVQQRIMKTFQAEPEYHVKIAGIDLDSSASARIVSFQQALQIWAKSPLFGHGVTGTHFVDGQYFRVLAETGIVGLSAFLFMIWRLLRAIWKVYGQCQDKFLKGAVLGLFCGLIATLTHAISANSFIIIRIAEPLWLLAGLMLLIPKLSAAEETVPVTPPLLTYKHGFPLAPARNASHPPATL